MARRKGTREQNGTAGPPALIPQPHGGALMAGGLPGNRGGSGRPQHIRLRSAEAFDRWLDWAEQRLKEEDVKPDAMNQIGSTTGKYGLGTTRELSVELVRGKVQETASLLRDRLPAPLFAALLPDLKTIWNA